MFCIPARTALNNQNLDNFFFQCFIVLDVLIFLNSVISNSWYPSWQITSSLQHSSYDGVDHLIRFLFPNHLLRCCLLRSSFECLGLTAPALIETSPLHAIFLATRSGYLTPAKTLYHYMRRKKRLGRVFKRRSLALIHNSEAR